MKRRSNLWTVPDSAEPPAKLDPKVDLDGIFADLMNGVDKEPSEEETAALTNSLRRDGNDEAADLIDAEAVK